MDTTVTEALAVLTTQDVAAAFMVLAREPDPSRQLEAYHALMRQLYWEQKDLQHALVVAWAGMQHGLTLSAELANTQPETAYTLRSLVKGLAYDLASFTWPGWDEPGVEIPHAYLAFGHEAARINLRLAHELNKPEIALGRASWIMGAHDLAKGDSAAAQAAFLQAAAYADQAGAADEALLARGFASVAALCSNPSDPLAHQGLAEIKAQLGSFDNGSAFVEQLETAARVFLPPPASVP